MRRHHSIALVLASALVAAPAFAAEPGEGTVSVASPKVMWAGQSVNGGATLVITSDREVTGVVAEIRKGAKVLGRAKLARLSGSATVKVKLRRALRRGTYAVALAAKQGTRTVGLTAKLTVKR